MSDFPVARRFPAALEDLSDPLDIDWSEESTFTPALRGWAAMALATQAKGRATLYHPRAGGTSVDSLRRFPSLNHYLQTNLGGMYGLSVMAGRKGLGKSMWALGIAIEAAATMEWQVYYLNAEMDQDEIGMRFDRYLERWPASLDCLEYLRIVNVPKGYEPVDFVSQVESTMDPCLPILVVVDSINTIAELCPGNYLHWLKEWQLWAMLSRRMSRGACSFLLLSELNKAGRTKGEKLEHWADVVVTLKGKSEERHVEMELNKTRRTGGEGPMGRYIRHIADSRFYRPDEVSDQLRLVEGGTNE